MMVSLYLSPEEILKKVMGDPSHAILKQKELSETTYPLLISYLEWLRKINSIKSKRDVIQQNERLIHEFVYLCEHNLIFFLTVSGRFDIIRSLFKDKDLPPKETALLDKIEKEQAQVIDANLHHLALLSKKKDALISKTDEIKFIPPTSEWEKELFGLTHMKLYQYYEEEIKRINYFYHVRHINHIEYSFDEHMQLVQQTIQLIEQDENIDEEMKDEARSLLKELTVIKDQMHYYKINQLDEIHDQEESLGQHLKEKQEQLESAHQNFDAFLEKARHKVPGLQEIYEVHHTQVNHFKRESLAIQREWEQEIHEHVMHYENARHHALKDIDKSLNLLINEIQQCPVDDLDEDKINLLDTRLNQLKECQKELKTIGNYQTLQVLLDKCHKELKTIGTIIAPVLAEDTKIRFASEITLIENLLHTSANPEESFSSGITSEEVNLTKTSEMASLKNLTQEQSLAHSNEIEKNDALFPLSKEPIEVQSHTAAVVPIELNPKEHGVDPPTEDAQAHFHRYRFFMNTLRDETELILFDSEKQRNYESLLKELSQVLSDLNEEVEPEMLLKIKEIEGLIKEAKSIGYDKASPSHIQKICEACDLGLDYEPLNQAKSSLASFIPILNISQNNISL